MDPENNTARKLLCLYFSVLGYWTGQIIEGNILHVLVFIQVFTII